MRAVLLHFAMLDLQDICIHLKDAGTTYKAAMDALNKYFEPKNNVVFKRHVFCQAIQGLNEPSINFVTVFNKLASTCEFVDQNTEIRDQFIDKC